MTLATRCPHCQTAFRLVPDQLRLAEGWVRCGRCDQIFPATEHLLGNVEPFALPEPAPFTSQEPAEPQRPADLDRWAPDPTRDDPPLYDPPQRQSEAISPAPQTGSARHLYQWERGPAPGTARRWPIVSAFAITLLLVGLLLQVLWWSREDWGPDHPHVHQGLAQIAGRMGWTWPAPRALQHLELESGELTRLGGQVHELRLVLVNRHVGSVALPAFELSLQDAAGQTVIRRVLLGRDLGLLQTELPSGQRLPLQLGLDTDNQTIAGYTVELFYP